MRIAHHNFLLTGILVAVAFPTGTSRGQTPVVPPVQNKPLHPGHEPRVRAPGRPATALFRGQQGKQKGEIDFNPATGEVTIKMLVQDPNGYFIPHIRRDNFAVFENGVRQHNASVEIEHAPVSLAVLMEWGGRYQALNEAIAEEVPQAARELLDQIGRRDKIALFRYGDQVERIADFSTGHEALDSLLARVKSPDTSELNFYDAVTMPLQYLKPVGGRKALLIISSGIDTFSRTRYEEMLTAVRESGIPVYVLNVGPALRVTLGYAAVETGPYARLDWNRAEKQLQEIATASGGRLYSVDSTLDLSGVYDDLMENLRVRYVIAYKSNAATADPNGVRTVRVQLVNPANGGPLEIVDSEGKTIRSTLYFEDHYVPNRTSGSNVLVPEDRNTNKEQ